MQREFLQIDRTTGIPYPSLIKTGDLPDGFADKTAKFDFDEPSDTWEFTHNFAKFPSVQAFDNNGNAIEGLIIHTDINNTQITYNNPVTGYVTLN